MKSVKYKIVSDSMMPLIPVGAEIEIEKIDSDSELKLFDILLFKNGEHLVCHYFWHQNEIFDRQFIVTRNLKDGKEDLPIHRDLVIGRVHNFKISKISRCMIYLREFFR